VREVLIVFCLLESNEKFDNSPLAFFSETGEVRRLRFHTEADLRSRFIYSPKTRVEVYTSSRTGFCGKPPLV
jgi:hypothetical protein